MKAKALLILAITCLLMPQQGNTQACTVSLGADTTLCGGGFVLTPALSVTTFGDSLEITYDATQGQTGLVGAQKVYLHSGAEMVAFGGWQYQVGNWGQDDGLGQMQSVGQDLWQIHIHPESYYGYPAGNWPVGIFMVFRNADGSQTGKDANGDDIWLDMGQEPPASAFGGLGASRIRDGLDSIWWSDGSGAMSLGINGPGTFWVAVADTGGCIARDTIVVSQGSIPVVDLGQPVICDGNSVLLDAGSGFAGYTWSTGGNGQTITVSQGGLYWVTVTDGAGCEGSDVVNVPELSVPDALFSTQGQGLSYTFSVNSQPQTSYAWDFDGNGSTDLTTTGNASHTYAQPGAYTVRLVVGNACGSDSSSQSLSVSVTRASPIKKGFIKIYPNPATEHVFVRFELNTPDAAELRLMDIQGRVLHRKQLPAKPGMQRHILDIEYLPQGVYLLEIRSPATRLLRRVIRE